MKTLAEEATLPQEGSRSRRNGRNAAFVFFSGGARQAFPEAYIVLAGLMFPAAHANASVLSVNCMEVALRFATSAAFAKAILGFIPRVYASR